MCRAGSYVETENRVHERPRKSEQSGENKGLKHTPELEFELASCKPPQNEKSPFTIENGRKRRSHLGRPETFVTVTNTHALLELARKLNPGNSYLISTG
jgi:hypothetical protein